MWSQKVRFEPDCTLRNDVSSLRYLLERLHEALQSAQQIYLDRGPSFGVRVYEPLSDDVESERKVMVGDFVATLTDCDDLLKNIKKIQYRYGDAEDQLNRHLSRQGQRAEKLCSRVQLHSEKIRFALERLSIKLFTDQDGKEDSSHNESARPSLGDPHAVNETIERRFQDHILIDAPNDSDSDIPLPFGLDALLHILHQSTSGPEGSPENHLQFLKARWFLSCLKESAEYRASSPGFYYKRAVNQVTQAVLTRSGELLAYDEAILSNLPDTSFRIWPDPTRSPTPPTAARTTNQSHPLMPRVNEVAVACIQLATEDHTNADSVTVFKSSNERFRIVLKSAITSRPGETSLIPLTIHTSKDKPIPRYALPTITNPTPEMAIFSRDEETLYKFSSFQDLYKFRATLIGYDVSHDQADIRCQFSDGRVLPRLRRTHPAVARAYNYRTRGRKPGPPALRWEADTIKLPVIVIFTQLLDKRKRKRFATIFIELERGIYVDATECGCCKEYDKCSKLVLVKEKKPDFTVRVLYSEVDATGQPNPNTFDIFPFRLPRHPRYREMVPKQTKYLVLKFRSLSEKKQFHRELDLRFRVRDKQITDQRDFAHSIRHRQDRPEGRQQLFPQSTEHLPSPPDPPIVSTLPPIIDVPDTGPALDDAFARGSRSPSIQQRSHLDLTHPESPRHPVGRENELRGISTTVSPTASAWTTTSASTSIDSLSLPNRFGDQVDQLISDIAKSRQNELPDTPVRHEMIAYNDVKEYYGVSEMYTPNELGRSPSSLAPEPYNYRAPRGIFHEAPDFNTISPVVQVRVHDAQQTYEQKTFGPQINGDARDSENPPRWGARPVTAVRPYDPDSITGGNGYLRRSERPPSQAPLIPLQSAGMYVQIEVHMSRSKTGKPKARWKAWQR